MSVIFEFQTSMENSNFYSATQQRFFKFKVDILKESLN